MVYRSTLLFRKFTCTIELIASIITIFLRVTFVPKLNALPVMTSKLVLLTSYKVDVNHFLNSELFFIPKVIHPYDYFLSHSSYLSCSLEASRWLRKFYHQFGKHLVIHQNWRNSLRISNLKMIWNLSKGFDLRYLKDFIFLIYQNFYLYH